MSRIIVVVPFFVAFFVGVGLGLLGVPTEMSLALGFIVTGAAVFAAGKREALRESLPVNPSVVGVVFAAFGALFLVAGLSA